MLRRSARHGPSRCRLVLRDGKLLADRPRRHVVCGDLGHQRRLPRDRIAVKRGQHLAASLAVHIIVDDQDGTVAEQTAEHHVRLARVIDARSAREHLLDL
jgi:hypothetical protein